MNLNVVNNTTIIVNVSIEFYTFKPMCYVNNLSFLDVVNILISFHFIGHNRMLPI